MVTDADTLAAAGPAAAEGFGAEEAISVKGRREPVRIRRHPGAAANPGA